MKIKAELVDEIGTALGDADEMEFTFLLVPVVTYSVIAEQAGKEGCSVGEVLQKALLQYLRAANGMDRQTLEQADPHPVPDMVIRRNKRR